MFEGLTDAAYRVLVLAEEEARTLGHNYLGTEHVLLGLVREGSGAAAGVLSARGLSLDVARKLVVDVLGPSPHQSTGRLPLTPRAKRVLELARREARDPGPGYVGSEHLLLGLIRLDEGVGAQILAKVEGDFASIRSGVKQLTRDHAVAAALVLVPTAVYTGMSPGADGAGHR